MAVESDQRRSNFLAWMKDRGTNVARVSAATGIPTSTIYGFTRGEVQSMRVGVEQRIAEAHHTTVDVIFGGADTRSLEVVGHIGARAEVRPFDEGGTLYEVPIPPTLDANEDYVGFEIEGLSMPPARPGWVVVFRKRKVPLQDLVGFPCLVDLADGQRLFKELRRGYSPGRWNLVSWDGSEPLEDREVVAALPFIAMTPGRMGR